MAGYKKVALEPPEAGLVERLSNLAEFVRSYEISSELAKALASAGVIPSVESYGLRGILEEQWPSLARS